LTYIVLLIVWVYLQIGLRNLEKFAAENCGPYIWSSRHVWWSGTLCTILEFMV